MQHRTPFFILANPRSGSSLLRIICECNAKLTVPPESGFLLWWEQRYGNVSSEDLADPTKLEDMVDDVLTSKKIETWQLDKKKLLSFIKQQQPKDYATFGSLVYYFYGSSQGKSPVYWGDKNNYYIHHLEAIIRLYPEARFLHLVRDGRDVACSYLNLKHIESSSAYFPNLPTTVEAIASEWDENNKRIAAFLETLPKQQSLLIPYEDVVLHLETTARKICEFLGVAFDPNMLTYHQWNRARSIEPQETLDWKKKTLEKPDSSRINQYRNQLSPSEIKQFETTAAHSLQHYGYL